MLMRARSCAGCRVQQLIDLVNCEEETFPFAVVQSSLLCEDQTSSLKLEPPSAVLPPKTRSDERKRLQIYNITGKQVKLEVNNNWL